MNDVEYPKHTYIECECDSSEHTLRFSLFLENDPKENSLYTEVQLTRTNNIFKRLWLAIKYVCGYQCKYGHWDCCLLSSKDVDKLIDFLQLFKNGKQN